jgi:hypothetical protein
MNIVPAKMADNPVHRICLIEGTGLLLLPYLSPIDGGNR